MKRPDLPQTLPTGPRGQRGPCLGPQTALCSRLAPGQSPRRQPGAALNVGLWCLPPKPWGPLIHQVDPRPRRLALRVHLDLVWASTAQRKPG